MKIITGYTGENHVASADDASLHRGILGAGDYVLEVGSKFAATIIDNNTARIADGDLVIQGHQARIRANDYNEVTIDNGTPGEKRNDLIVARYQKNTTTGIESITLEVIKGTPGATAVDPEIIQGDLTIGNNQRDFALYRVSLNGLALENVTSLFTVLPNIKSHSLDYTTLKNEFLGRIEYLLLDPRSPEETAHRFNVPLNTNKFFVLNQKNDEYTTVISVSSYSTDGIVWTVLNDGATIAITTNADKTAIFFRPGHSTRGFVITTQQG